MSFAFINKPFLLRIFFKFIIILNENKREDIPHKSFADPLPGGLLFFIPDIHMCIKYGKKLAPDSEYVYLARNQEAGF